MGCSEHSLEPMHKVFLSHSGAQKDFVEQLCKDLESYGRYPFFDKCQFSLPIGEKFPKLIFDAIEQCQVGVVILSEEFVMSKWPMLELNAVVKELEKRESTMTIILVFDLVSVDALKVPENLHRWERRWKQFALNDDRINVEEWKKALGRLGPISRIVKREGYVDVQLREEIVMEVCKKVAMQLRWDDSHVQGWACICEVSTYFLFHSDKAMVQKSVWVVKT